MAVLITGGAGYIGSATVADLLEKGEDPVIIDNLVYGHRKAIDDKIPFYEGEIGDKNLIRKILQEHEISACMHFSAFAYVGESVEKPHKYWQNNVEQTLALLEVLLKNNIKNFIFSSTCATYGEPNYVPIDEKHTQNPTNPYGWSKLFVEKILESYDKAYSLRFVSLRYFNACGATGNCGEDHNPETHLIAVVLQTALGQREKIYIFGEDYDTPDGTAVRDYIHISDLAQAHILALEYLRNGGSSEFINLGNGQGFSVKEVINAVQKVTGKAITAEIAPRRTGDPSKLVGDAAKAKEILGWKPEFTELEKIIESAWNWHQANPEGYQ